MKASRDVIDQIWTKLEAQAKELWADDEIMQTIHSLREALSDRAVITEVVSHGGIDYQIVGQPQAVEEHIERLFHDFDPRGYGTTVRRWNVDGQVWAIVHRAASCD